MDSGKSSDRQQDRERLLERVRKLYAMSQETEASPHEAEIALRRCQSLMAKFGISESDLETSAFGSATIGKSFRALPSYVGVLSSAVALLHDCLCVVGSTIEFRGYSIDAEVARLSYDFLSQAMERSLKLRKSEGRVPPGRSASFDYRVGFAIAVLRRCRAIDQERRQAAAETLRAAGKAGTGTSLVVRKLEAVEANCAQGLATGRARKVRYRSGEAHAAGTDDGARVSLDAQLAGNRDKQHELA